MTTLVGAVGRGEAYLRVSDPAPGAELAQMDAEIVVILEGAATTIWLVQRGALGTTPDAHADGTEVVPVSAVVQSGTPSEPPITSPEQAGTITVTDGVTTVVLTTLSVGDGLLLTDPDPGDGEADLAVTITGASIGGTPTDSAPGDAADAGPSTLYAPELHVHGREAALSVDDGGTTVQPVGIIHARGTDAAGVQVQDLGGGEINLNINVSSASFPTGDEKDALDAASSPSGINPFATIGDLTNLPTSDEKAALDGANSPSGANVVATIADLPDVSNLPTSDEKAALDGADTPSAGNVLATVSAVDAAIAAADAPVFWLYDFAIDGGAQGTIPLRGPTLDPNVFVNAAFIQVLTPFGSGGSATVALTTGEAAGDIDAAANFDNAKYSAGMHFPSVHKLTTDTRQPAIVIDVADLNAGSIKVFLDTISGWG